MNKVLYATFLILILNLTAFAQKYGNEWIDYSLKYSKISVNKEGLYKITFDDVVSKNLFPGQLNPEKFQLFNKGVEIPIFMSGDQDGSFDQGDELYFYGNKNDASLDKILYASSNDLPNNEVSLFTDNNYYFLTYNPNKNGLRYQISNLAQTGLISEPFIIAKDRLNFDSSYYSGEYILDAMSLSEYTEGEGYLGPTISSKEQALNYQLNTSNFIHTGYGATLSFYIAGRSNASSTNSSGKNHHFRVSNNSIPLFDSLYRGYASIRKTIPFNVTTNITNITLSAEDDLGAVTDYQSPGYVEIKYSRNLNINGLNSLSFNLDKTKPLTLLNFVDLQLNNPIILEKSGVKAYRDSGNESFVIKDATPLIDYYLADQNTAIKVQLNDVVLKNIGSASSKNYLIISNSSLKAGAEAYQQYNESISMPTSVVYTEDLFNEFYYGFHHPIALRNYCNFMIEKGTIKPEYLLLLGKGYEKPREYMSLDLVPTVGYPASDNMLTSELFGSQLQPKLATGRIPASTNQEILTYLEKVKTYRQLGDPIWRKKIVHITGGRTNSESVSFKGYLNNLSKIAEGENFGANTISFHKDVSDPVTENITDNIITETEKGTGLISFLGHGSATVTAVSLGSPTTINNPDKPTVYLINGCSTGNAFSNTKAYSESMLLQNASGAIIWIGTTSEGVASYLFNYSNAYYKNWFKDFYGKSIAFGLKKGIETTANNSDKLSLAHARQFIFLGDPSLTFFHNTTPNFSISNDDIYLSSNTQNASQENLKINFIVKNFGKSLNDSLNISLSRTLPNKSEIIYNTKIKPILNQDTLKFDFPNTNLETAGTNIIKITLNADSKIIENDKSNNIATYSFFLPGNGVNPLFPIRNSVVNADVILEAEPDDLFSKNISYLFEIDTVSTFDSGFKQASPNIVADIFPKWKPDVKLIDKQTYFWRVKINDSSPSEKWATSQFTFYNNSDDGLLFTKKEQLNDLGFDLNKMDYSTSTGAFSFKKALFSTNVFTRGDDVDISQGERRIRANPNAAISYIPIESTGITMVTYSNKDFGEIFSYPSPFNSIEGPAVINGYTGQYFWDTNKTTEIDSMIRYINQIPEGYFVIGVNNYSFSGKALPIAAKNALNSLGLSKFEQIDMGEPYLFYGTKGASVGSALEYTADYTSSVPARSQSFKIYHDLEYISSNTYFTTGKMGPAIAWKNIDVDYLKNKDDNILYSVIGVNKNDLETALITNSQQNKLDLSAINANTYPFLKLKVEFINPKKITPPSLTAIKLAFDYPTELSFDPTFKNNFHTKSLSVGDSMKLNLGIANIYKQKSQPLTLRYTVTREDNTNYTKTITLPSIEANSKSEFTISEDTKSLIGKNSLKLQLLSDDLSAFNDAILFDFDVLPDKKEPLIDVSFDGKRILNGDIVSPTPVIEISSLDENKFLLQQDTSLINVYLQNNSDGIFKRINYSDNKLNVSNIGTEESNKLTLHYIPDALSDGNYSLKVVAKDASGNISSNKDFVIDFEVINESTITHFYPYPNPVVNSMRFVYTLTGSKIPDKIKIQILTASGKVVKEISKEDLGIIRTGNNISDFTWDGTDQFGDRLANGVYFYRVFINDNDKQFKSRRTAGDKNFKNNVGKIYLLK